MEQLCRDSWTNKTSPATTVTPIVVISRRRCIRLRHIEPGKLEKVTFSQMNERTSLTKRSRLGSSRGITTFAAVLLAGSIWIGATGADQGETVPNPHRDPTLCDWCHTSATGAPGCLTLCREHIATLSVLPRRTPCRQRTSPRGYGPERTNGPENPLGVSARERNAQLPELSRCRLALQARQAHRLTQSQFSARRARTSSPGILFSMPRTSEL